MASFERSLLLSPDAVARRAARWAPHPEARWMLAQARSVRAAYVREVLDQPDSPRAQEIWMLRQPEPVRESYVTEVLEA
jgi:hypothetical protein